MKRMIASGRILIAEIRARVRLLVRMNFELVLS